MSDKFLGSGQGSLNLTNGSASIYSATLGASSLSVSKPIKTNSTKQLVSSNLDITDINNLQTQLNEKDELIFVEDDTHTTPDVGKVKLYAKTDGNFYKKNDAGTETLLAGGGGVSTSNAPVDNNSIVIYDGTSGNSIRFDPGFTYDPVALKMSVSDIQTINHPSVNAELSKVRNITSATQAPDITDFSGEIHVAKIKSASHNTELEFETNGAATLTADDAISLSANGTITIDATPLFDTQISGDNVIVQSNNFTFNGSPVVVDTDLTDLNNKTQNIDLALTNTGQTSFNSRLQIATTNSFNNQIAFNDLTNPRASTAVGFVIGNGNDGPKWILGSFGDIDKVVLQTYTSNDNLLLRTNDLDTIRIKPNGSLQLERTGVYDGTVDAMIKLNTDGTLEKSSATCDTAGNISATTIAANSYTEDGNTATLWKTKGTFNYLVGLLAGQNLNAGGAFNICVGNQAGQNIDEGDHNVCIGYDAGRNITGTAVNPMENNVAIGNAALRGSTGNIAHCLRNIGIGNLAGAAISTGVDNIFMGSNAGQAITTGSRNCFIGSLSSLALPVTTTNSVSLGFGSSVLDGGINQNALGYNAVTTQDNQVCLGNSAVTEIINAGNGTCSLGSASNYFNNVYANSYFENGYSGTMIKNFPLGTTNSFTDLQTPPNLQATATNNIFYGLFSGDNVIDGTQNTCLGLNTMRNSNGARFYNTCVGFNAGQGTFQSTFSGCTMIGVNAGEKHLSGDGCTYIGKDAGNFGNQSFSNVTAIGSGAFNATSNQVSLGNASVTSIINTGVGVCDIGSTTNPFKDIYLNGTIKGMPYDFSFACTDEVNTITATGQKISIRAPRAFQTSKIKVSVNSAGGAGFAVDIKKNGVLVQSITINSLLIVNTNNTTTYNEDDIITCEVVNIGTSTATGLKVYLIGKTL